MPQIEDNAQVAIPETVNNVQDIETVTVDEAQNEVQLIFQTQSINDNLQRNNQSEGEVFGQPLKCACNNGKCT